MICTSIIPSSVEDAIASLKGLDLAEVRLEGLNPTKEDVANIFNCDAKIVATNRPAECTEQERQQVLEWAIECGAAYVDLEIEAGDDFKRPLVEKAKASGCKVIVSYHNYESTPALDELQGIIDKCFEDGADIAKVACLVRDKAEAARILGLADTNRVVIPLGMGAPGIITRVAAPLLGSPFTFAPMEKGLETAPGQIDRETLESVYRLLKVL